MATYSIKKERKTFSFDPTHQPILEIDSGDTVPFETGDVAYERLSKGETVDAIGLENFNAVTGPVFVRGAEPGDALKIEILDVQVSRACSAWLPAFGGLGQYTKQPPVRQIELQQGRAYLTNSLPLPIKTIIGCICLAP